MSVRDKFSVSGADRIVNFIKSTTQQLPDISLTVISSSPDTVIHVLPKSNKEGINFYTISGAKITPDTKIQLWPGESTSVATIVAKIDVDEANLNDFPAGSLLEFPVQFDLEESPVPTGSTSPPSGPQFVCRPCLEYGDLYEACPAGYECRNISGQRCCVEANGTGDDVYTGPAN